MFLLSSACCFLGLWREAHLLTWAFWISLTFSSTVPQAVVVVKAFNRRVNCLNVRKLQHPHTLLAKKFVCFVLSSRSESRLHINRLCMGMKKVGWGFEEHFWPLLALHFCIDSCILPRGYGDRGWIGAHRIILIIVNLFNIIVCMLQNPTLNPSNLCYQDGNWWIHQNLTILISRLLLVIRNEA